MIRSRSAGGCLIIYRGHSRKDGGHDEACEGGIKASQVKMDSSQEAMKPIAGTMMKTSQE
jgi:hypothetical protein